MEWLDQKTEIREKEIFSSLARYFGSEALDYIDFYEKIWAKEKFSGGCPASAVTACDSMKDYARGTREPFYNVHFAGTETAINWMGYIDGAAESGIRAANEVLYRLNKNDSSIKHDYEKTYYFLSEEAERNRIAELKKTSAFDYLFATSISIMLAVILYFIGYCFNQFY